MNTAATAARHAGTATRSDAPAGRPTRPLADQMIDRVADRSAAVGMAALRYGLALLLLLWGAAKFTSFEAEAIRPLMEHSPLLGWLYTLLGARGGSAVLGVVEVPVALLIAARRWAPRASGYASLAAAAMFCVTLSLLATTTLAPSTLSLLRNMFLDPRRRTVAVGVWIASYSAGAAVGPLVGGALLEHFWWGSVFLVSVPVMALLLVAGPVLLPEFRDPDAGRVDVPSAALSLAAVLAVIYGLKQLAEGGPGWGPALVVAAGVGAGAAFVRRQRTLADPLVDLRLFRAPAFSAALGAYVVGTFAIFGVFVFVGQYLQLVLGLSPLRAGLWTVPSALAFVVGSLGAPAVARRLRPGAVIAAGLALAAVGFAMLIRAGATSGPAVVAAALVVSSLGLAPVFTLATDLVVGAAPPERAGVAAALSETGSELGGALGIAVLGSVGTAVYRTAIVGAVPLGVPREALEAARRTLGGAVAAAGRLAPPADTELLTAARGVRRRPAGHRRRERGRGPAGGGRERRSAAPPGPARRRHGRGAGGEVRHRPVAVAHRADGPGGRGDGRAERARLNAAPDEGIEKYMRDELHVCRGGAGAGARPLRTALAHVGRRVSVGRALAVASCAVWGTPRLTAQLVVRETSLGARPAEVVPYTVQVSAAMRLAYVVATPDGETVVVDGVRGPVYDAVHNPLLTEAGRARYIAFSPDGTRFAYRARRGDRTLMVVDGVAERPSPPDPRVLLAGNPEAWGTFSPDSRHYAYRAGRDRGAVCVVRDGVAGPAYDAVPQLLYSADGEHLIYRARRGGRDYAVVDGREVAAAERIGGLVYSDSAGRLAYTRKTARGWAVVVDGVEGPTYARIDQSAFSRDGRRFLYVARGPSRHVVVADGVESRGYERVLPSSAGFSDDGRHVAFAATDGARAFWVLDGVEQAHYDHVTVPAFRPSFGRDGARLAYAARRGDAWFAVVGPWEGERFDQVYGGPHHAPSGHVVYQAMRGARPYVGVDSATFAFDQVAWVSPSRRLVISARRGARWHLVVDGAASPPYEDAVRHVAESRDARRIAYAAGRGGRRFAVVDGVEGRPYDQVGPIAFSPDGRHVAYSARRLGRWVVVVDGRESPGYDEIVGFPDRDRMGGDAFVVLARRGKEDLRIAIPWRQRA